MWHPALYEHPVLQLRYSLLNSMYSRGILFCFASALSFKQHQKRRLWGEAFSPFEYCLAICSQQYTLRNIFSIFFFFFIKKNVCVRSSILTLICLNYNLKKNLKICKITSNFANILIDDPPLLGVEPRIFSGCRICQDIIFIHQDITNARDSSVLHVRFM